MEWNPKKQEQKSGKSVAFIGAGVMATALAGGMVKSKVVDRSHIFASDISSDALFQLQQEHKYFKCRE